MPIEVQNVTLAGERFVILPEAEYLRITGEPPEPSLPAPNAEGNYPAREALRALMARKLIRQRRAAGLTQVELARRAGISAETLNRLEHGKHAPSAATMRKLDGVFQAHDAETARDKPAAKRKKG